MLVQFFYLFLFAFLGNQNKKGTAYDFLTIVENYSVNSPSVFASKTHFIDLNEMLIEIWFIQKENIIENQHGVVQSSKLSQDTAGLHVIDLKGNTFYLMSGWGESDSVKYSGTYGEHKKGIKSTLFLPAEMTKQKFSLEGKKDTVILNQAYIFFQSKEYDQKGNDSLIVTSYTIKHPFFYSIFNKNGGRYSNDDYVFAGISVDSPIDSTRFTFLINNVQEISSVDENRYNKLLDKVNQFKRYSKNK